jgi:hypothetical protein
MVQAKSIGFLAVCFATTLGAQTIVGDVPATIGFVDISAFGGTAITGVGDDSEHTITTTIGNSLFPAGNVRISNNGVVVSGLSSGDIGFTNETISTSGVPGGLPGGGGAYLCVLWDDHIPLGGTSDTTIWWREADGVLYILWKGEEHFSNGGGGVTTFELQVFSTPGCGPAIQFVYPDTTYAPGSPLNNGASATIGYVVGTNPIGANVLYSFDTAGAVPDASVVSVLLPGTFAIAATSPFGPGSLRVDLTGGGTCGDYLLAVTLNQGAFPGGWLFGLDIPFIELANELAIGAPYVGTLAGGNVTLGPFGGLPSFTFYAVGIALPYYGVHTAAISYTIP